MCDPEKDGYATGSASTPGRGVSTFSMPWDRLRRPGCRRPCLRSLVRCGVVLAEGRCYHGCDLSDREASFPQKATQLTPGLAESIRIILDARG
jgi:hypothetical protein